MNSRGRETPPNLPVGDTRSEGECNPQITAQNALTTKFDALASFEVEYDPHDAETMQALIDRVEAVLTTRPSDPFDWARDEAIRGQRLREINEALRIAEPRTSSGRSDLETHLIEARNCLKVEQDNIRRLDEIDGEMGNLVERNSTLLADRVREERVGRTEETAGYEPDVGEISRIDREMNRNDRDISLLASEKGSIYRTLEGGFVP